MIEASAALPIAACAPLSGADQDAPGGLPKVAGAVVRRTDADYEAWRQSMIWQRAKADRRPDMIVQAESVDDVVSAVKYAARRGMKVTTRAGGHSMAACFLRNGGMLIDVSRLDGVKVDKGSKTAEVGPGVICSGLAEILQKDGLAFPTAHCGTVPISGYLLGGGVGMNTTGWSNGMSVFAVKGVDIVTADGKLRHATETKDPELFWAARGGGPGLFGVVTRFYLQCFDAPGVLYGATYTFPYSALRDVVQAVDQIAPRMDRNVETLLFVTRGPPELVKGQSGPGADQVVYVDANAFAANPEAGRKMLAPLMSDGLISRAIARDEDRKGTWDSYFVANEAAFPQTYWMGDNIWCDRPLEAADILAKHIPNCPTPRGTPLMLYQGENKLPDAACSTTGRYYLAYYVEWEDPGEEAANRAYCLKVFNELKTISRGSYINEMDQEGRVGDIAACYSPDAWRKLAELRKEWDPKGVFHGFYGQA